MISIGAMFELSTKMARALEHTGHNYLYDSKFKTGEDKATALKKASQAYSLGIRINKKFNEKEIK
jgi:hypothetical protein